jgi:Family of unknown function (DUF6308)
VWRSVPAHARYAGSLWVVPRLSLVAESGTLANLHGTALTAKPARELIDAIALSADPAFQKVLRQLAVKEVRAERQQQAREARQVAADAPRVEWINEAKNGATTLDCKMLARKRPHLVPILDAIVTQELSIHHGLFWLPLHTWLTVDDRANHRHLESLRSRAGLGTDISVLRVFDVLTWMTGEGYANT